MVFNVMSKNGVGLARETVDSKRVPITVDELTKDSREDAITVLDLSDPRDRALCVEAGFTLTELTSCSQQLSVEQLSPDSTSATLQNLSDFESSNVPSECAKKAIGAERVKDELRCRIQAKRLQKGQEIAVITEKLPKKVCRTELSPEEEERKKQRRLKNKLAARKCRDKRQARVEQLEKESSILLTQNETLKDEIKQLKNEMEMLVNMVKTHDRCPRSCNTHLSTSFEAELTSHTEEDMPCLNELEIETEYVIESCEPLSPLGCSLSDHGHLEMPPLQ